MSKKHKVLTGVAVVGMSGLLLTNTVFANDPPYISNTPTEITITRINEAENKVWAKFSDNGLTTGTTGKTIEYGHILWGGRSNIDDFLPMATIGNVYGSMNVYMGRPGQAGQTIRFLNGVEEEITAQMGNLTDNEDKTLVYAFQTFDGDRIIGRVDYGECAKASTYQLGMECRGEILSDGLMHYVPYDGETRVYVPPTEVIREVEVPVEVEIEVPVEVEIPVEKIVEVPTEVEKIVEVVREVEKEIEKEVPIEVTREVVIPRIVERVRTNFVPVEIPTAREDIGTQESGVANSTDRGEVLEEEVNVPELGGKEDSHGLSQGWLIGLSGLFGIGVGGFSVWFLPPLFGRKKRVEKGEE